MGTLLALPLDGSVLPCAPKVKVLVAELCQEAARLEREVWDGTERPEESRIVAVHISLDHCSSNIRRDLPQTPSMARGVCAGAYHADLLRAASCPSSRVSPPATEGEAHSYKRAIPYSIVDR